MRFIFILLLGVVVAVHALPVENFLESGSESSEENEKFELLEDDDGKFHIISTDPLNFGQDEEAAINEFKFKPERDVYYALYTRENPRNPQYIVLNDEESLVKSNFNVNRPTRFVIHGYINSENSEISKIIHTEYMIKGDFNVILVDWSEGSETINYLGARNRIGPVGLVLGKFIRFINANLDDVYLIGHSLGAHVAGNAGRFLDGKVNTIIGMDPAAPLISTNAKDRLYVTDAQYVEIIHTNAKNFGWDTPIGHADFYPNGGKSQPGCPILDVAGICDHARSFRYFAESITTTRSFMATQCQDYKGVLSGKCKVTGKFANMGGEPSNYGNDVSGIYYLQTNKKKPFASGPEQ